MAVFRVADRRTRRDTHDMILMMAKYGDHYIGGRTESPFKSDADVKRFFAAWGTNFRDVVEECRDKDKNVPCLENLVGTTWEVHAGGGGTFSYIDESGEETLVASSEKVGWFSAPAYGGLFEQAVEDFKRCLDSERYGDFLSCISNGVASIEAYLSQKVKVHNKRHPRKQFLDDKHNKVSFDDKIDKWIPAMTGGKKLDKGNQRWEHFKKLRAIRDGHQAHVKVSVLGSSRSRLGGLLNLFRTGIAGLLLDLHILFDDHRTPATVIRHAYLPPVEVITTPA